jgi:hypothetical protein
MNSVNSHKLGLVFGGMMAIVHAVWSLLVFMGIAKLFMDWIFGLHFLSFQYSINPFDFPNALILVVVTSVIGYALGYVCGWLWNLAHRTSHGQ